MDPEIFVERYPTVYHMSHPENWPSIRQHGLLSTRRLLELHGLDGSARRRMLHERRDGPVELDSDGGQPATLRGQTSMSDDSLRRALEGELTPADWYRILNERVFFWVTRERLERMLNATHYRDQYHLVMVVDSRRLLERHGGRAQCSPYNSGCTRPFATPRGRKTFQPMASYPYEEWRRKRGGGTEPVVELAIPGEAPGWRRFTRRVQLERIDRPARVLWEGPAAPSGSA